MEPRERLADLLAMETMDSLPVKVALSNCSELVNLANDLGEAAGAKAALKHIEMLHCRKMASAIKANLHYFEGNAWLAIDELEHRDESLVWKWDREEIERALLAFRRACREPGFQKFPPVARSRVFTNLANTLNTVGRFVAASDMYRKAIQSAPTFGMPRANLSISFWYYAWHHYDTGHQSVLRWHSHTQMRAALKLPLESGAKEEGASLLVRLREAADPGFLDAPLEHKVFSLGDMEEEVQYRRWCLANCLYLNALNDCLDESVAAADPLHLPTMVRPIGEGLGFHSFFNQIKQEYVSARFMLYEALHNKAPHFSDHDVKLVNTLDYPSFGLGVEKTKWAFRAAASILDKVAVFLAWYLGRSKPKRATFRTVWYQKGKLKKGLQPEFESMANWPLRGLFWLSKDLCGDTSSCGEFLDPDGARFKEIRNALEHRYVKVLEYVGEDDTVDPSEEVGIVVGRRDFEEMGLRYLSYAREALIYLSLGINSDQMRLAEKHGEDHITMPVFLPDLDDEWKR